MYSIRMGVPEMEALWKDLAIEPHPEDKKHVAYDRISLSDLPPLK